VTRFLPDSDFRCCREVLEPHDFAFGPSWEPKPTNLISVDDWKELTLLPEDFAVRTSNHNGDRLHQLVGLWAEWLEVVGDQPDEFVYVPMLDAADDFQAATFDALHGYYRQAIAGLRSACDSVAISATCQAGSLVEDYVG
jgi:hypothetical protein